MLKRWRCAVFIWVLLLALVPASPAAGRAKYFVLVVWDGMRPDFVTPELTPTLYALRQQGVWFANHHPVYPSSTEVNGTALATGCYPADSHITANNEYRPEVDPLHSVAMQSLKTVRRGDALADGKYLAVPTVAERLRAENLTTAIVGAKAVALLHDRLPRGDDSPNPVWFADGCLPPSRLPALTNLLGAFPAEASPNIGRDQWAARCLTEAFWGDRPPRYSLLWLSEPDASQHLHGPGSSKALAAIRNCDERLATVLAALDRRGVRAETDVIVVSDHGFSTIGANCDVGETLRAAGFNARATWEKPPQNGDVEVVGNGGSVMLYVIGKSPAVISNLVAVLQQQPFSGVIFTRTALPGTFPLAEVKADSPMAPDIVVSLRWHSRAARDEHPLVEVFNDGYHEYSEGCGMHVTLSPTDLHNTCVAAGPDFRAGVVDSLPSGNVDIAPTLLWLMNVKSETPLDGRVLSEAFPGAAASLGQVELDRREARAALANGTWEQHLNFVEIDGVRYLEEGNGQWTPAQAIARKTPK
jgi:arylsulfatase A-like enzyme